MALRGERTDVPEGDRSSPEQAVAPGLPPRTSAAMVLAAQQTYGNAMVARAIAARQAGDGEPAPEAPAGLIVAGDVAPTGGQMTREAFLARLRESAVAAASEAVQGTIWELAVDSAVDEWLAPYRQLDATALEAAVKARVPAAAGAHDAGGLIAAVKAAVRETVARRLESEEQENPPFSMADLPGAKIAAEVATIMFKRRDGALDRAADPLAVRRRLGPGTPLDGAIRARMEPVLGEDLSSVRLHADGEGARVASELGARAFATGRHVAFGAGEYAPGTPVGDALLAHELAHVGQQDATTAPGHEAALEQDADAAAAGAVTALWAPGHAAAARLQRRARLRDALAVRRCTPDKKSEKDAGPPAKDAGPSGPPVEPMPANPKQVYDQKLAEAIPKMKALFGRAEKGYYDEDFWEKVEIKGSPESALKLRAGRYASDAITSMVEGNKKWTLDCAQAVQLAHLYALRYALGATEFNRRVGGAEFMFRPHDSSGVEGATEWWRPFPGAKFKRFPVDKAEREKNPQGEEEPRTEQQLLDAAPVGSRVMFTNQMADNNAAFHHENSLKLGPDSYAAHGFDNQKVFTRAELSHALAKSFTREAPTQSFVDANVYVQAIETYKSDLPGGVPSGG